LRFSTLSGINYQKVCKTLLDSWNVKLFGVLEEHKYRFLRNREITQKVSWWRSGEEEHETRCTRAYPKVSGLVAWRENCT